MSSLPNSTNIPEKIGKRHRHRRSAAISGDFDGFGLGLIGSPHSNANYLMVPSSPRTFHSNSRDVNVTPQFSALSPGPSYNDDNYYSIDKDYEFDNEADYCNEPTTDNFTFPMDSADSNQIAIPSNLNNEFSDKQKQNTLSPPFRFQHRKSASTSLAAKNTFFLTEETRYNNDNIPDAVIDLDKITDVSNEAGNLEGSFAHKRTKSTPLDKSEDDTYYFPFSKSSESPRISTPLQSISNTLFQQPIKESRDDEIDDAMNRDYKFSYDQTPLRKDSTISVTSPSARMEHVYSNSSATTSNSSLPQHKLDDSEAHSGSSLLLESATQFKRSGAKANRYQSFYDQSFKVSNALRVASSESLELPTSSNSQKKVLPKTHNMSDVKSLGHASSYPNFRTSSTKKKMPNTETKNRSLFPTGQYNHSPLSQTCNREILDPYTGAYNRVRSINYNYNIINDKSNTNIMKNEIENLSSRIDSALMIENEQNPPLTEKDSSRKFEKTLSKGGTSSSGSNPIVFTYTPPLSPTKSEINFYEKNNDMQVASFANASSGVTDDMGVRWQKLPSNRGNIISIEHEGSESVDLTTTPKTPDQLPETPIETSHHRKKQSSFSSKLDHDFSVEKSDFSTRKGKKLFGWFRKK